jgi:hypothetical protein
MDGISESIGELPVAFLHATNLNSGINCSAIVLKHCWRNVTQAFAYSGI